MDRWSNVGFLLYIQFRFNTLLCLLSLFFNFISCGVTVNPCSDAVCQLRVEFLDLSLAPPNGDGVCNQDILSISGGATNVPNICGENSGQHVIVEFSGTSSITVSVTATAAYTFGRHWHIKITQINCDSRFRGTN